jgi:hypothetical protein
MSIGERLGSVNDSGGYRKGSKADAEADGARKASSRGGRRIGEIVTSRRGIVLHMVDLVLHARSVKTVFDLIGHLENDMTAALGWTLSRNSALLDAFLGVTTGMGVPQSLVVELQEHDQNDGGYTDVELRSSEIHVIIEAKRGWTVPSEAQLRRYEARFLASGAPIARFVVLTQNGAAEVVRHQLGAWSPPSPIELRVLGWSDVVGLARKAAHVGSPVERNFADGLATYLFGVADMRDTNSNKVWVVPLQVNGWDGWPSDLTPVSEVERHRLYHYPSEGSYPRVVPNYIAFRYGGRLQSIHHVDGYEIVNSPYPNVPGAPRIAWDLPHFLLRLGAPIKPAHTVASGGVFGSARHTADLDLLLTSASVKEAVDLTKQRQGA